MPVLTRLLFPDVPGVRVERVQYDAQRVQIDLITTRRAARCPLCHRRSRQVRSRYSRTLQDLPCAGRPVVVHVRTRRFVCGHPRCPRRIFAERLPALVAPTGRRTLRAQASLQRHGFDLGGEAGARHTTAEGLPVSPRTLLRLVRAAPLPVPAPVRVLGVDDWCKRKGRTYGTILVDLERHVPIDLLPDRTAATFAAWLRQHPTVEVISRDRGGAYAEGARQGAPQAQQIADRWHLLANLSDAVEEVCGCHRAALKGAARAVQAAAGEQEQAPASTVEVALPPAVQERRVHRVACYEEVMALHTQGATLTHIARQVGLDRATVRRYVRSGLPQRTPQSPTCPSTLRPYVTYLQARWTAGCQRADRLYADLYQQGYRGSARTLRRFVATWRPRPASHGHAVPPAGTVPPPALRLYSPRQTVALFFRSPEALAAEDQAFLHHLAAACPVAVTLQHLVRAFHALIHTRDHGALDPWLTAAGESTVPELTAFVRGIHRDRAAVDGALTSPWSQGQVEGQVTRVKLLKRSMFGRAKMDLLRQRVLHRR